MSKSPGIYALKSLKGLITATRTDINNKDQVTKFVREECLSQLKKILQDEGEIEAIIELNRQNNVRTMSELNSSEASIHPTVSQSH